MRTSRSSRCTGIRKARKWATTRTSRVDRRTFIANLRLVLEVEVHSGKQTASKYSAPGLWELLQRIPREHWPVLLRGDRDWGTEANMQRAEQEGVICSNSG